MPGHKSHGAISCSAKKGGGSQQLTVASQSDPSPDTNTTTSWLRLQFSKSSARASAGLGPGTCAWPDRAMYANEPSTLSVAFRRMRIQTTMNTGGRNGQVSFAIFGYEPEESQLRYLLDAIQNGREFQVHVHQTTPTRGNRDPVFKITKIGP
jgi:hypothetical protein